MCCHAAAVVAKTETAGAAVTCTPPSDRLAATPRDARGSREIETERDAGFETPTLTDRTSCIFASPLVRLPFKKLLKSLGKEVLLPNESIACSRQANASTHSRLEESHMRTEQEICVHVCVSRHRDSRDRSAPEKSGSTIHHEETLLPSE